MYYAKLADYQEEDHDILILVLMEDTLRELLAYPQLGHQSLNPYFNGRYSQRIGQITVKKWKKKCLNPCFNGRYSQSVSNTDLKGKHSRVLILVLMEDTLRVIIEPDGRVAVFKS